MRLQHGFQLDQPPRDVFDLLLDVERVAACLPGARLIGRDGEAFKGSISLKVRSLAAAYEGAVRVEAIDESGRTAVFTAAGAQVEGQGHVNARMRLHVAGSNGATEVTVLTDVEISGPLAQFGRRVLEDIGGRIIDQFAQNLEANLISPPTHEPPAGVSPQDLRTASLKPTPRSRLPFVVGLAAGLLLGVHAVARHHREPRQARQGSH